jgi:hypothetical protein
MPWTLVFYGHGIFFGIFFNKFAISSFSVHEVKKIGIDNLFGI